MKLYEINFEIEKLLEDKYDPETGEILNEIDWETLNSLTMQRDKKIENIALLIKNLNAETDAIKTEKDTLAKRERRNKNKIEGLKQYLISQLGETKFTTPKVAISFRQSEIIEIDDENKFIEYLENTNHDDLLSYKDPIINKIAVKQAIKNGVELVGCRLNKRANIQIR